MVPALFDVGGFAGPTHSLAVGAPWLRFAIGCFVVMVSGAWAGVGGIGLGPSAEAGLSPARHSEAVRHKVECNPVGVGWLGGRGRSG